MIIKLIPIIERPGQQSKLFGIWHYLADGVRKVLSYVDGDQTEESIYNDLLSGVLSLQVIFLDDKYVGFITGRFDIQPNGEKNLFINHFYLKEGMPKDVFNTVVHEKILKLAQDGKCKRIVFNTMRKGLEKKLEEQGYKIRYVEMTKELEANHG